MGGDRDPGQPEGTLPALLRVVPGEGHQEGDRGTPPFPERLDLLEERDWASVRDPKCLRPEPVSGFWPGKVPGAEQWVPLSFLKGFGDEPTPN